MPPPLGLIGLINSQAGGETGGPLFRHGSGGGRGLLVMCFGNHGLLAESLFWYLINVTVFIVIMITVNYSIK